tara:strand:+ start:99 stop:662 length:564 start_codon:yes stop_codon:yes gene_type:complete
MNSKKLIIYEYDILFEILKEINENYKFDLVKANQDNFDDIYKNAKQDFLIILKNKKEKIKNQIVLDNLPMKINKILELINIRFLKNKFNIQSNINIGSYNLNLNSRQIIKKTTKLNLTERETNLIIYLSKTKSPVKVDKLQREVWDYGEKLETHTVETHIYRLRKKIKEKFDDENFIISLKDGYKIN